jgi:hypothetical protein
MTSDPPALTLRGSTPDAVVDVVDHGVLEARLLHGAVHAYTTSDLHPYAITREESVGVHVPALTPPHPRSVHGTIVTCSEEKRYDPGWIRSEF